MAGATTICVLTFGVGNKNRMKTLEDLSPLLAAVVKAARLKLIGKQHVQLIPPAPKEICPILLVQGMTGGHAALRTFPAEGLLEITLTSSEHFPLLGLSELLTPFHEWASLVDMASIQKRAGGWCEAQIADTLRR